MIANTVESENEYGNAENEYAQHVTYYEHTITITSIRKH